MICSMSHELMFTRLTDLFINHGQILKKESDMKARAMKKYEHHPLTKEERIACILRKNFTLAVQDDSG